MGYVQNISIENEINFTTLIGLELPFTQLKSYIFEFIE